MKKLIFVFIMFYSTSAMSYEKYIYEPEIDLSTDYIENIDFVNTLQNQYAVDLFGGRLTANELDSIVTSIQTELKAIPSQKIKITKLIHLYWTKLLHKASEADLHFRLLIPEYITVEGADFNPEDIKILPFTIRIIENQPIIDTSIDNQFKKGDIIISINDTPIKSYLEHYPASRTLITGKELQIYYHFSYAKTYSVKIERNGTIITSVSYGQPINVHYPEKAKSKSIVYREYNTGYFNIIDFFSDGIDKRAEEMALFVDSLQQTGINNLIIDIRNNPGGNDEYMYNFFSIMTDKATLLGTKSALMRVSDSVITMLKHSLPEEMIAKFDLEHNREKIIDLSDIVEPERTMLDGTMCRKDMTYYILMDEQTSSTAASFARLSQLNEIATLAGQPTLPNPDNNGNVFEIAWNNSPYLSVYMSSTQSTFEGEDKTVNGRIMPDIEITYTVEKFANYSDPQLEKLLEIIKKK